MERREERKEVEEELDEEKEKGGRSRETRKIIFLGGRLAQPTCCYVL